MIEGDRVKRLCDQAYAMLPAYLRPDGLFCHERVRGERAVRGRSVRYTLITLLGLLRANRNGRTGSDLDALWARSRAAIHEPDVTAGDLGLYLWCDSRRDRRDRDLLSILEQRIAAQGGLGACVGMEIGWIVIGCAEQAALGDERAKALFDTAFDALIRDWRAPSNLFHHDGRGSLRANWPSFASQIYNVLALARAALLGLDPRARALAIAGTDALVALQEPTGEWPWLYDVRSGSVVERYEVYSVHQDGMAPMALLEMTALTGDRRYADAAAKGLPWIWGANELGLNLVDEREDMIYRSIRRRPPFNRLFLAGNLAIAAAGLRAGRGRSVAVELNASCRPYHLGWVLEAWEGRESALEGPE